MGGSIDSMTEGQDRFIRENLMGQDPKDYGIDVDAIDKEIDAKLAKVKQPEDTKPARDREGDFG